MNPMNPNQGSYRVSRPNDPMDEGMGGEHSMSGMAPRRSSVGPWILVLTIVVVLGILTAVFHNRLFPQKPATTSTAEFQAVFLTNGQVYFGKLSDADAQYATLQDIYYLQVTPILQTKTQDQTGSQPTQQQGQQLSIVKLGNELHAPMDIMKINRDQILFFEDLKPEGKVVDAIHKYEQGTQK